MSLLTKDASKFKNTYTGTGEPSHESWIVKTRFDTKDLKFVLTEPEENSLLLKQEYVMAKYEYAIDKLIIHVLPRDLLIVHNMQVKHRIQENDLGNT